jgi:L-lactate dehydrogenase complex protein LldG
MTSREKILSATKQNQPSLVPLPEINIDHVIKYNDLAAQFELILTRIGGTVVHFQDEETMMGKIKEESGTQLVINTLNSNTIQKEAIKKLKSVDLENIDTAYVRGALGIAENGSVWIDELSMVNRLLPFICQHLVVVLHANQIVATMHHAYQQIDVKETGFGSFIAGPSKTADIEQSLVIGAHGPRSLTLFLVF